MRKIIISLLIIGIAASLAAGGTIAFFNDTEKSVGNTFTAGTIEIAIDDELHWSENFAWNDAKPGKHFQIAFEISNQGVNPLKLWKIIKCVSNEENGIIEPEQAWYDEFNNGNPKNDLDTVIIYEMEVDGMSVVNKEAGITISQIKDSHVSLLKLDPGADPDYDGILEPGESVSVVQRYYLPADVENWAQSDQMIFTIALEARQTDAPEPLQQISFLNNKYDADFEEDETIAMLKYDYMAPTFNYDFLGLGLNPSTEYCLIYYADGWPGNNPGYLFASDYPDSNGNLSLSDQAGIGMDLPAMQDQNFGVGAKIWLFKCSKYDKNNFKVIGWSPEGSLIDNWPGFINYRQGERPNEDLGCTDNDSGSNTSDINTAYFNTLGKEINQQYGYFHDYSAAAGNRVYLNYTSPMDSNRFSATMQASDLKPYATYQLKFEGKPVCLYGGSGNDLANKYIGEKGRWTCVSGDTCIGGPNARNRSDSDYENISCNENPADPDCECMVGYLVFDYLTADDQGDIAASDMSVLSETSYHVLFCGGGTCNSNSNNFAAYGVSDNGVQFCQPEGVNGQPESGRGGCGGLTLDSGVYDLKMALTEECFHLPTAPAGTMNWAEVLTGNIHFEIN